MTTDRPGDDWRDSPAVYDHVRLSDGVSVERGATAGVYRVVGTSDDAVTLLRVADAVGRRRHTGEVISVPREMVTALEPAANPDENRSVRAVLVDQLQGFWWSLRVIGRTVIDRPIPSAVALALVVVGLVGDAVVDVPDPVDTLLFLVGVLTLVYLSRTSDRD